MTFPDWANPVPAIPLADLTEGVRFCSWDLPLTGELEHWGQSYRWTEPLHVEAEASRSRGGVVVELRFSGGATTACARCLSPAPLAIEGKVRYFYSLRGGDQGETEFTEDQILFLDRFSGEIDLTAPIWESLVLSLPAAVLCREDCRGLCPRCGADLNRGSCSCPADNADPRLEALREIKGLRDDKEIPEGGN